MKTARLIPVFSLTFIVAYQIFDYFNVTLIRYYPDIGRFSFGRIPGAHNAIGWFGWMGWALVVALAVSGVYALLPRPLTDRVSWGWAWIVPIAVACFALYIVVVGWWLS